MTRHMVSAVGRTFLLTCIFCLSIKSQQEVEVKKINITAERVTQQSSDTTSKPDGAVSHNAQPSELRKITVSAERIGSHQPTLNGSPTAPGFGDRSINLVAEKKVEAGTNSVSVAFSAEAKKVKMPDVPTPTLQAPADPSLFKPFLSGYVRFDAFADTRQVIGIRGDVIALFPTPPVFDTNGNDIFDAGQIHMVAIRTYMKWAMQGPVVWCAKTRAEIGADFSGPWCYDNILDVRPQLSMSTINGLALTDAYFAFDWDRASLLFGQTWHPLFDLRASAGVVLMEPIARAPQVRWTKKMFCNSEAEVTFAAQVDNLSSGPSVYQESLNPKYTNYLRLSNASLLLPDAGMTFHKNSVIPDMTFTLRHYWNKHIFGLSFNAKWLKPRLATTALKGNTTAATLAQGKPVIGPDGKPLLDVVYWQPTQPAPVFLPAAPVTEVIMDPLSFVNTYYTNERVFGFSTLAYAAFNFDKLTFKLKGTYAENLSDQNIIGGYGVVGRCPTTGREQYAPFKTMALVAEVNHTICNKQISLSAGYSKNMGIKGNCPLTIRNNRPNNNTKYDVYGLAPNMKDIWKITPTVKWVNLPIIFALGMEFARAQFGDIQPNGKITNTKPSTNIRTIFSGFYFF